MRQYFSPSIMATIKSRQELARKQKTTNPPALLMEYEMRQPLWKTGWQFLKRVINIWPSSSPPRDTANRNQSVCTHISTQIFIVAHSRYSKSTKPKYLSTREQIRCVISVCTRGYCLAIKRSERLMNPTTLVNSVKRKKIITKYIVWFHLYDVQNKWKL